MTTIRILGEMPAVSCAGPERPISSERKARRAAAMLANTTLLQRALAASKKRTAQNKRDAETYRRRHNANS
jgi:hypothetical protein